MTLTVIAWQHSVPPADPRLVWLVVGGGVLGLFLLYMAMRVLRRKRLIQDLPTSKVLGTFIGLVELKGTAESERPFVSYLAACRCVYLQWTVEEHWSRTVTETYTDSEGRRKTRTRRESGWKTVAEGGESAPFYLEDDTGTLLIRPDGAKIETQEVFDRTCRRNDPLYYDKGPRHAVAHSDHRRRFREEAIPLHAPLYVVGTARERHDIVAPEIAKDDTAPLFLISTRGEQSVTKRFGWSVVWWSVLGLVLWIGGFAARDIVQDLDPLRRWQTYALTVAIYGGAWMLGWAVTVFNGLVRLRRRVDHAWSLIDIQLKRRHDLIGRIVATIEGLRDYERTVHTELTALRHQMQVTAPGRNGPEPRGLVHLTQTMVERYPDLQTQEGFLRLQRLLVETEQRIALAREYFNHVATHHNVRRETIPDRWIARLARARPRDLWEASDFERARVEVTLAT